MASKKLDKGEVLSAFFDEGVCTELFGGGAVSAVYGCANGQPVYVVYQNGEALSVKDVEKNVRVLDLAAQTGNPVVTFYNSVGAKLAEGLDVLTASAKVTAASARLSGVVPQVAVVLGVCGATAALNAAAADVCIMAEQGELFFTAPFTSAAQGDKLENAGTAQFAAKAGVAALVAEDAVQAASLAAHLVGLMPGNNLAGPALFQFEAPAQAFPAKYQPMTALEALADTGSLLPLYSEFGAAAVTAIATVNGNAVGLVASGEALCEQCASKISRFVRLCDAFSIPVVTVVDCQGFLPSVSQDLAGGIRQAARLAATYADATTAKVAVVAGSAVGPVYTALANADLVIAMQGSTIAPVAPSVAVSVLYKDELDASDNVAQTTRTKAAAYAADVCSAAAAVEAGAADFTADSTTVRATLVAALDMLATKRSQRLPKKHGNMAL